MQRTVEIDTELHETIQKRRSDAQSSRAQMIAAAGGNWDQLRAAYEHIDPASLPDLEEWEPTTLFDIKNFFLVFEGKRRTGKSTFAKWLLQLFVDKFSLVWVMSNTKKSGFWPHLVGDQFCFDHWEPAAMEKLWKRQDGILAEFGGEDAPEAIKNGSMLLILDDVISSKIHDDPHFKRLAVEGRHSLISIILMTQDPKAINPAVRDNADVVVVFNQKTFRNKESIWHDFMNDVPKDIAVAMMNRFCEEHDCLVSIQSNLNRKIQRMFFKSTSDKTILKNPDYCLGGPEQRAMIRMERAASEMQKKARVKAKRQRQEIEDVRQYSTTEVFETKKTAVDLFGIGEAPGSAWKRQRPAQGQEMAVFLGTQSRDAVREAQVLQAQRATMPRPWGSGRTMDTGMRAAYEQTVRQYASAREQSAAMRAFDAAVIGEPSTPFTSIVTAAAAARPETRDSGN